MESNKNTTTNQEKTTKKPFKLDYDKKAQINNEIIQCQEKFKQAKICTIRKLVEKLKHPEKNPKQNRTAKTERYQNVLNELKHMSPKRLAVLALINRKSGKNYLADQNSTIEQLAVAYFSEYKTVKGILDAIENKLNLSDSWDWKKTSKKLFKKKDETAKTEKVQKKAGSTETDNTSVKGKKAKRSAETNAKAKKSIDLSAKEIKKQKKSKTKKKQHLLEGASVEEDAASVESDESSESEDESDTESTSAKQDTALSTTVDEFFITADGSNYMSTAVSNTKQDDESDDESHPNRGKEFIKKPHEASFFHKSDKKPPKQATNRIDNKKRKWTENEDEVQTVKEPKLDPELHPSWQAKQKQKPIITEFKGKKITFD